MLMPKNTMYEERYYYTLGEITDYLIKVINKIFESRNTYFVNPYPYSLTGYFTEGSNPKPFCLQTLLYYGCGTTFETPAYYYRRFTDVLNYIVSGVGNFTYVKYIDITDIDSETPANSKAYGNELIHIIMNKYWNEYICYFDEELDFSNITSGAEARVKIMSSEQLKKFWSDMITIMLNTYLKYTTLLNAYENNKNYLLDKLKRNSSVEGSGSGSNTRRDNDTPQDSGDFTDNTHTSFYTEGTDSNERKDYRSPA